MAIKGPRFISPETKEKMGEGAARVNPLLFDLRRCQLAAENRDSTHSGRNPGDVICPAIFPPRLLGSLR